MRAALPEEREVAAYVTPLRNERTAPGTLEVRIRG
jgi:hypothetical protein